MGEVIEKSGGDVVSEVGVEDQYPGTEAAAAQIMLRISKGSREKVLHAVRPWSGVSRVAAVDCSDACSEVCCARSTRAGRSRVLGSCDILIGEIAENYAMSFVRG